MGMLDITQAENADFDPKTFNTRLGLKDEMRFIKWKEVFAPGDSGEDYDLRGAFKAGLTPDRKTGHWPDTYKKPNHPTFSDESRYAKFGKPGRWEGETFIANNERAVGMIQRDIHERGRLEKLNPIDARKA